MMLLHLVKKDFLLVKKNIYFMMLLAIAVPLFAAWRLPEIGGAVSFIYTVVFTEFIICQSVSVEESKYPKSAALLCSVPYQRSTFVKAKYMFFLLLFAYCYVVYTLMAALAAPAISAIDLTMVLSVLLVGMILYGVYLPLYFKFGAEKTKFFFMICIFTISFGYPAVYQYFSNINIDFSMLVSISTLTKNTVLALACIIVWVVSQLVSIRIFSKKDL